jgi:hypothetical protein
VVRAIDRRRGSRRPDGTFQTADIPTRTRLSPRQRMPRPPTCRHLHRGPGRTRPVHERGQPHGEDAPPTPPKSRLAPGNESAAGGVTGRRQWPPTIQPMTFGDPCRGLLPGERAADADRTRQRSRALLPGGGIR